MEQDSKITWESPVESAEQMLSEQAARNEWLAELRKQLAESEENAREMICKMDDEEVIKLADMCLDEMELRDYSVLRMCVNLRNGSLFYMLDVTGYSREIASMLMYLSVKKELFAKCVLAVAKGLQDRKEEFVAAIEEDEEE
ncbi:MAG: hypothetical protein IKY13_09040 [Bacteroidaceae bacterium]|nr:hypothetical protein [Bacteroidaceae bacterium]